MIDVAIDLFEPELRIALILKEGKSAEREGRRTRGKYWEKTH